MAWAAYQRISGGGGSMQTCGDGNVAANKAYLAARNGGVSIMRAGGNIAKQ